MTPVSQCHQQVDLVMLMRCTGGVYHNYLRALEEVIKSRHFGDQLRVGVVSFYDNDSIVTQFKVSLDVVPMRVGKRAWCTPERGVCVCFDDGNSFS